MFSIDLFEGKTYGIMMSGGLDSSALLCIILDNLCKKQIKINFKIFTIPKKDHSHYRLKSILDFATIRYSMPLPVPIVVGDLSLHHSLIGKSAVYEIQQKHPSIDYLFFGSNKVPLVDLGPCAPLRPVSSTVPYYIKLPFINLYKTDIIRLIEAYQISELYKLTHSCTELQDTRCNTCWQCKERAWAFQELCIIDQGLQ